MDSSLSGATIFAVRMHGDSMDPKFPEGTILIFEHNKEALNGDFVLLQSPHNEVEVRQIFINGEKSYKKSLNPTSNDYSASLITNYFSCLGLLVQSRTNYIIR